MQFCAPIGYRLSAHLVFRETTLFGFRKSTHLFPKNINQYCSNVPLFAVRLCQGQIAISYWRSKLFYRLKSPPSLSEARRLHALLVVSGFFRPTSTDRLYGSQLVNVYVKFNRLQEALWVFDKLPQKSNLAWNAILRGFVERYQFKEAIDLFHYMIKHRVVPDNFTYPLVIKACSLLSDLDEGLRIREIILFYEAHYSTKPNAHVICAMIDMFSKCGCLHEARKLFEEMPSKDLACWTAIVSGALSNGEWLEAVCLFKRMRLQGQQPDSVIVATVLPACARLECRALGMALHGCAVESNFGRDLYVCNALIDMYSKCGDTLDALRIFSDMDVKDTVSWSTLIAGYSYNCLFHESFELYVQMINAGIRTNVIVGSNVLHVFAELRLLKKGKEMHCYILKEGLIADVIVGSALIHIYASCGSVRQAQCIFDVLQVKDITAWNALIMGYILHDSSVLAFGVFRNIWEAKEKPNSVTLLSILPLCTDMGAIRQGKEIHGYAIRSGFGSAVSIGNSLIDMYSKCGNLELALKIFNQMTIKNIVTYNAIISAHGIHGLGERAMVFFDEMKGAGIRPNKITFIVLLSACSHGGLVNRGWLLYNSMINEHGIQPDMEHCSCMVDLLGRSGNLHDAYKFITRMPVMPDANVLGSLFGACIVNNNLDLAELVGEFIIQRNPKDPGYYVLLSNLYASTRRWEDMSKIRMMIKAQALNKSPGSSWIQIGNCLYVFHSRSTKHPELHKIQETLDSLLSGMKDDCACLIQVESP